MKRYISLNEDFFDDKEEILQNADDIDSIKTEYEHTVIIWLSISNYAATNENVFASVLKSFESRVSAFFNSCRFIRDFSDFSYKQNSIKEELTEKILNLIDEKSFEIDVKDKPYKKLVLSVVELWNLLEEQNNG